MLGRSGLRCALAFAVLLGTAPNVFAAEDGVWSVVKSSGEVFIATSGAQQLALKQEEALKPGDTIRTGRNGRVLLVRGEETMMVLPNSVIGLPAEKKEGLSTTIKQQAGSILLEVEKRNVKHFEVETPYLAAVVKGTQFSVTVNAASTSVEVRRGQVEVSDFKTGQIAQVMAGQAATVFLHGKSGITLTGSGTFNPIEQGKPRPSTFERIPILKSGSPATRDASNGRAIHALGGSGKAIAGSGSNAKSQLVAGGTPGRAGIKPGVVRISNSLGEVKLDFAKVTHGLAHGSAASDSARNASKKDIVWSDTKASTGARNNGQGSANDGNFNNGNSGGGNSAAGGAGMAAVAGIVGAGNAGGNGNGAANANHGNAFAGNGNNGNNGIGNNGNGNGNGNAFGRR